jgi:nucleotide-binding universal stress UspA family protein
MKILIAIDGSENSKLALWEVARRKWDEQSEVKIIHVLEAPIPPMPDVMGVGAEAAREEHQAASKSARALLDEAAETIRQGASSDLTVTTEIITARPFHSAQEEIVSAAERDGTDLIILGSRGMSRWKRLLLGSVSTAVIQHAPCSVEIVRPKRLVFEQED